VRLYQRHLPPVKKIKTEKIKKLICSGNSFILSGTSGRTKAKSSVSSVTWKKGSLLQENDMNGQSRKDIHPGLPVAIVLKRDQRSGKLTQGIVRDILTSAPFHSRGIKVRLEDGQVGRVHAILENSAMGGEA
jgi:uncharacterized repeat protein (TIGR03833 family)